MKECIRRGVWWVGWDSNPGPLGWHPSPVMAAANMQQLQPQIQNPSCLYPYMNSVIQTSNRVICNVPIEFIEQVVNSRERLEWMKTRYILKSHAIYCFTSAKLLPEILRNTTKLKELKPRRAHGVLEAITALRDFMKTRYGIELVIDAKFLRSLCML